MECTATGFLRHVTDCLREPEVRGPNTRCVESSASMALCTYDGARRCDPATFGATTASGRASWECEGDLALYCHPRARLTWAFDCGARGEHCTEEAGRGPCVSAP